MTVRLLQPPWDFQGRSHFNYSDAIPFRCQPSPRPLSFREKFGVRAGIGEQVRTGIYRHRSVSARMWSRNSSGKAAAEPA